ncbi:divalent metal cation transporter [Candidatus Microgenomates bacterium]|nr:divalent metal cation transporter [Candidatus Microgenomates bacterium]
MKIKALFKKSVPGIITGAADNDPSGISTYSIAGAQFGYGLNWLMVIATPMLIAVEAMCARLSDVTKKGLSAIINEYFPKPVVLMAIVILALVNIITVGADLAGMSAAIALLSGFSSIFYVLAIAIIIWIIIFFANFRVIQKYLLWLVLLSFSYILAAFLAKPNWLLVLKQTVIPTIIPTYGFFAASLALLGTTITPYLFFWQSSEEIELKEPRRRLLARAKIEDKIVAPGFIASNVISIFIMIAAGTVLYSHGVTDIRDGVQAAQALEPLAGQFAKFVFAIGLLGAGFLAVPVLVTTTAYAVAETFGWRDSLSDKISKARGFYTVIGFSIIIGVLITAVGIDPIKALFYSQVLAGILTPFLLFLILILCNRKKVMGKFTNGWFDNFFGFLAFFAMLAATIGLFWQFFKV